MNSLFKKSIGLFLLAVTLFSTSCRKDDFDNPPAGGTDPVLAPTDTLISINSLKDDSTNYQPGQFQTIQRNWVISGVVTADDRSGNFYKTVIIQDATAAIAIRIDLSDYYTKYPIGRRVFVKLKGLVLGDYNDLIQLGGFIDNSNPSFPSVAPIPLAMINDYLLPGQYNLVIVPELVTISQVTNDPLYYQNRFVRFEDVEFDAADTALTYADVVNQASANRAVNDCNGGTIDLRSSNYATFAGDNLPNGRGTLTGIFSVYGNTPQMYIRDTYDIVMDSIRCNGGGGGPAVLVSIATARGYYTGTTTTAPGGKKIKGIVISDRVNANTDPKNLAIQDSTAGIVVRFSASHSFNLGDEVEVDISGQEVTEYAGLLEVNNVPLANATVTGSGTVSPRVTTIDQINANFELWESTLVQVVGVTITGTAPTYSGSKTITDATGNMSLYTRSAATFSGQNFPTTPVTVTGVLVPFNASKQICIRSTADVQ